MEYFIFPERIRNIQFISSKEGKIQCEKPMEYGIFKVKLFRFFPLNKNIKKEIRFDPKAMLLHLSGPYHLILIC